MRVVNCYFRSPIVIDVQRKSLKLSRICVFQKKKKNLIVAMQLRDSSRKNRPGIPYTLSSKNYPTVLFESKTVYT